jgi:hypothetical protein
MDPSEFTNCPHCGCRLKISRMPRHESKCPALKGHAVRRSVGPRERKQKRRVSALPTISSNSARSAAREKIRNQLYGPLLRPDPAGVSDQSEREETRSISSGGLTTEVYHDEVDSRQDMETRPIISSPSQLFFIDEDGELNFGKPDRDILFHGTTLQKSRLRKVGPKSPPPVREIKRPNVKIIPAQNNVHCKFCDRMIPAEELNQHLSSSHNLIIKDLVKPADLFFLKDGKVLKCIACGKNLTVPDALVHIEKHGTQKMIAVSKKRKYKPTQVCPECGARVEKLNFHLVTEHPWCPDCKIRLNKADFHQHFLNVHHINLDGIVDKAA